MDSSVSPKDEIWFLRVCHHISTGLYRWWWRNGSLTTTNGFIYGFFKDAVWGSECTASKECMLLDKELETMWGGGTGRDLTKSIRVFILKSWETSPTVSFVTADIWTEHWMRNSQKMKLHIQYDWVCFSEIHFESLSWHRVQKISESHHTPYLLTYLLTYLLHGAESFLRI